ncbi:hypothetical protein [Streptomyces sp. ISL-94]|uniref:hypothetical protein n=1 Tax=Streptomyces sp. ISL-94 TaxID=2819190 RepID=UPI001BE9E64A|nr:hypothetical protein [Streptomyces sp. ISL-94]MBT2482063.1 hypothetical protein [Streptomyces sp. ISL-94]
MSWVDGRRVLRDLVGRVRAQQPRPPDRPQAARAVVAAPAACASVSRAACTNAISDCKTAACRRPTQHAAPYSWARTREYGCGVGPD